MIAEAGLAALWLAAALCGLQLVFGVMALSSNSSGAVNAIRPVAIVQGLLTDRKSVV